MYTKNTPSSKQCFAGVFMFFMEDRRGKFMCEIDLFVWAFVDEEPDQRAILEVQ